MAFDLPAPVMEALNRLETAGFAAYTVGGCVRDWVLGMQPHDYDICTAAAPEEMQRVFRQERTIETGLKHGTLTVLLEGMPLEITTFRKDGEYLDGRHPAAVSFAAQVEEDLSRRDFTVNAMAYSPLRGLCDPFCGRKDCEKGVIRCVGEAERRFSEDALRILRALRFSARLSFPIEEKTAAALLALRDNLQKISRERIASELSGILIGKDCERILTRFGPVIFSAIPELAFLEGEKWQETAAVLSYCPCDSMIRFAAMLRNSHPSLQAENCAEKGREIIRGLKMPVKMMDGVHQLISYRDQPVNEENLQEMLWRLDQEGLSRLLQFKKALAAFQGENTEKWDALEEKKQHLLRSGCCYQLNQLAVKGGDLIAMGLRGPAVGEMLERIMLQVAHGKIPNDYGEIIKYVRYNAERLA